MFVLSDPVLHAHRNHVPIQIARHDAIENTQRIELLLLVSENILHDVLRDNFVGAPMEDPPLPVRVAHLVQEKFLDSS